MAKRLGTVAMLIGLLCASASMAQPANDTCATAVAAAGLPLADVVDTTTATVDAITPSCLASAGNSVWYSYAAVTDTTLDIDTTASAYGATIAVFDGGCAAPAERACFSDPGGADSRLSITVAAGTTVWIQLSDAALAGGILTLEVREAPYQVGAPVSILEAANSASLSTFGSGVGFIGSATALNKKKIAFGATGFGIFSEVGGVVTKIAATGDATPVGGTYSTLRSPTMLNANIGAFSASIQGLPGVNSGIFLFNGAVITPIAVAGDPAPSGGSFTSFGAPTMNLNGDVAFIASTDTAPTSGIFELPFGGALGARVVSGAANPCGGTFLAFNGIDLNIWGDLVFSARGLGGPDGIFATISGVTGAVACDGNAEPSLGGVYEGFGDNVAISDVPWVVFRAEVDNGSDLEAIYAGPPAAVAAKAFTGQVAVTGETIDGVDRRVWPAVNNNNEVAFTIELAAPDQFGLAFVPPAAGPQIVAKRFDPCGAGTIRHMGDKVSINNGGTIIVQAGCGVGGGVIRLQPVAGLSKVAFHNDGTGIGAGFSFELGEIDVAGDTVLVGDRSAVYGVGCTNAVCTPVSVLAAPADPWPGGRTVRSILAETVGGVRRPVFTAAVAGVPVSEGIGMVRGGGVRSVVEIGDPTPDGAGTYSTFAESDPFDPNGGIWRPAGFASKVAFTASLSHPTFTVGVFIFRNGTIASIAGDGQPSPDGGTFVDFSSPSISGSKVAFAAETSVGACVMFAKRPTLLIGVACVGDSTTAGVIDEILGPPSIDGKTVLFAAAVSGGSVSQCIFARNNTGITPLVCDGDPQPVGGTFATFQSNDTDYVTLESGRGTVALSTVDLNDTLALHSWKQDTISTLAVSGAPAPGGGTFDLDEHSAAAIKNTVVFHSLVDDGTGTSAVFHATLP